MSDPSRAQGPLQERTVQTRDRIERAAMAVFSEVGFDAASTYAIAERAGVRQQLITYHYGTKQKLWEAAVDRVFSGFGERFRAHLEGLEGVDEPTRLRLLLREFMRYSAEHPEVARLMMHEGGNPGPRLTWLYQRHSGPFFRELLALIRRAQDQGLAAAGDPVHFLYLFVGSVGMFTHRAEAELVNGGRAVDGDFVEGYIEFVLGVLLGG